MKQKLNVAGFDFIKLGHAYLCERALLPKGKNAGKPLIYNKKELDWRVALKFDDERFRQVGESAYLVTLNGDVVYVGEYSNTFESRWLRDGQYIWHGDTVDNEIKKALTNDEVIELWITVSPFINLGPNEQINVSKAIEHKILQLYPPKWNRRNVGTGTEVNQVRVTDLLSTEEKESAQHFSAVKRQPYVRSKIRAYLEQALACPQNDSDAKTVVEKLLDLLPSQKAWQSVCEYPELFSPDEIAHIVRDWLNESATSIPQLALAWHKLPSKATNSTESHDSSWGRLQREKLLRVLP